MRGKALVVVALAGSLALAGCGAASGQTVEFEGLTLTIPDGWSDYGSDTDGDYGYVMYTPSDVDDDDTAGDSVTVFYSEGRDFRNGGTRHLKGQAEGAEDSFSWEETGERDIDGASSCVTYDVDYYGIDTERAYIETAGTDYCIDVTGDSVSLDDVLDSVSFE